MARDTMFRNSQFQAEQAAQGREYTYRGLTQTLPGALNMAQGVQDMGLRHQQAMMQAARLESDLQEAQLRADTYRTENELRQMNAMTRRMELDLSVYEAQTRRQLSDMQTAGQRAQLASLDPVQGPDGWTIFSPVTGRPVSVPEDSPPVRRFLGQQEADLAYRKSQTKANEALAVDRERGTSATSPKMFDLSSLQSVRKDIAQRIEDDRLEGDAKKQAEGRIEEIDKLMDQIIQQRPGQAQQQPEIQLSQTSADVLDHIVETYGDMGSAAGAEIQNVLRGMDPAAIETSVTDPEWIANLRAYIDSRIRR